MNEAQPGLQVYGLGGLVLRVNTTGARPLNPLPARPTVERAPVEPVPASYRPPARAVARSRLMLRAPFSPRYRRKAASSSRMLWMAAWTIVS